MYFDCLLDADLKLEERRSIRRIVGHYPLGIPDTDVTVPDAMQVRILRSPEQAFYWVSPTAGVRK